MPTTEPASDDTMTVKRIAFHPKNAPMAPMSFTSPNPMASFLKMNSPSMATPHSSPQPAAAPMPDHIRLRSMLVSPCRAGTSALAISPQTIPPSVTRSGMIMWSKSTNVPSTSPITTRQ